MVVQLYEYTALKPLHYKLLMSIHFYYVKYISIKCFFLIYKKLLLATTSLA